MTLQTGSVTKGEKVFHETDFVISVVACGICLGQAVDDSRPASSNVMGSQYPRIHGDSSASFRLTAPEAKAVKVDVAGVKVDLIKGADGVWTGRTASLVPGFHYYSLIVDGASINDPGSETFFGYSRQASGIEVPEKGVDFYDLKDVPHGEIREHWYHSAITGTWRRCFIYAPPGYDSSGKTRYPVLYLQHGMGEDERGWGNQGHVGLILDNLIAAHKAVPMIIVMDHGYATRAGEAVTPVFPSGRQMETPEGRKAAGTAFIDRVRVFGDVVIKELIPMIDSTYRTVADQPHRAMAGLSMGGMQTYQIGLDNLDKFAYIGCFSGAGLPFGDASFDAKTDHTGVFSDAATFNAKVKLLWFGVGTAEGERFVGGIRGLHQGLEKAGIKHVYYESPGTAHEWQTWRRDMVDFAPRLFQE